MDPTEIKAAVDAAVTPVMTAFEAFKETNDARLKEVEKKGVADPVTTDKLAKIETTLSQYESLNQKLTVAADQAKAAKEASDRIEVMLARLPDNARGRGNEVETKARHGAWGLAVIRAHALGVLNLNADEQKILADVANEAKALNVGTDTAGGYLAPTEYVRDIIKGVTELSPARALARIRNTAGKSIQQPKRTGQFAARRVHENGAKTETTGLAYGLEEIVAPEMYALIDISNQMLEDSAFDMEAEIREEASEQFAVKEGAEFVSGTGVGEMEGILTNAGVGENHSGSAATIADADGQANGLLTLKHALKTAYAKNASWIMNRTTIGSVRKLKDADKNYIWMPGIAQGRPNTIDGDPYVEFPDMPNEGAGLYPIAYGDFKRAYTMVDRIAMEMLRDPYTQATSGNIRFIFRRRNGGKVVLAEAIRKLECATL
ncbi:phage major capsid protein [Allomesorhizobium alhagi]|uniref:HK97 family phage major capsid protein n=1 Tax=Mesorhizobium alhagi CCNWXJ12-2 TaxID=1107882 RepID=H0HQU7_9HYPH|nr:phage major capsid protein [Mesorhizobium alhagi]EHK56911.1 HK97 family phage major capsid protein [Mesorhizobium alhagi CCNWXJ12-2]